MYMPDGVDWIEWRGAADVDTQAFKSEVRSITWKFEEQIVYVYRVRNSTAQINMESLRFQWEVMI